MEHYKLLLKALEEYFSNESRGTGWQRLFLAGGCYWFANILHRKIPYSELMLNRALEHCGLYFDHSLYDVTGKISGKGFQYATEKDISYMQKNYIPKFDVKALEQYLYEKYLW